jgi:NAD(P)-dependent dehydrogenase (short-subunit alcohol dehydrogenase family)
MTNSYPFTVVGDEFKGKRGLVIGGTKGVGEAIVRRFALSRASVATTARSEAAHGQDSTLFIKADLGTEVIQLGIVRRFPDKSARYCCGTPTSSVARSQFESVWLQLRSFAQRARSG